MSVRRTVGAVGAALAIMTAAAGTAEAVSLHSYDVKIGRGTLEKLATSGFDVTEGRHGQTVTIVASAGQAKQLADKGVQAKKAPSRVIDDYGPGEGYRVYRPYNRPAYNDQGNNTPNL